VAAPEAELAVVPAEVDWPVQAATNASTVSVVTATVPRRAFILNPDVVLFMESSAGVVSWW
jgi:hypothetical protein